MYDRTYFLTLSYVCFSDKPVITCKEWFPMIDTSLNSYPSNVTGNPSPNITWYRGESPVSSEMRLSKNDSGPYKYVASNVMGRASCVTNITVECEWKSCKDYLCITDCFMIGEFLNLMLITISVLFRCS